VAHAQEPEIASDGLVHATWNRSFAGVTIYAFADHTYLMDIGFGDKIPLVSIGWVRWRPDEIGFPRWDLGPWPSDRAGSAPRMLGEARVLRYRGDVAADWASEHDSNATAFQGAVVAIAIVEGERDGGVLTLFLYSDGTVADEWHESLEDALEAMGESDHYDELAWAT
jgi:hypothetical protein